MKAQIVVDVVHIYVVSIPSLLHQNNIGVTYVRTSNFKMEPRFVPLYFVAMPQSMIIIIEAPFVLASVHTIDGVRSKVQTPRGTKFVSLHEDIPKEVNNFFYNQPSNPKGGDLNPP